MSCETFANRFWKEFNKLVQNQGSKNPHGPELSAQEVWYEMKKLSEKPK